MSRPDGFRGRGRGREQKKEFDHEVLDIARVARVVKGGRRFSFRATVAIGDRRGKIGLGVAKGADVATAIGKAINDAKKEYMKIVLVKETIPFEIRLKYKSAKILIKPAKVGRGIVAGGSLRILAELAGIKNISGKSLGSNNKINTAKAMILALKQLKAPEEAQKATAKGLSTKEVQGTKKQASKGPKLSKSQVDVTAKSQRSQDKQEKPIEIVKSKPSSDPKSQKPTKKIETK